VGLAVLGIQVSQRGKGILVLCQAATPGREFVCKKCPPHENIQVHYENNENDRKTNDNIEKIMIIVNLTRAI
jgi:hypothetical protein